jgi:hypothetical protein
MNQTELERLRRCQRSAFEHVLKRSGRAKYAREPLTAATSRYQANKEPDLTHAHMRGIGGVAQVAGERDLLAPAECRAVERGQVDDAERFMRRIVRFQR